MRRERGQDWKAYARSVLVFSALSFALLYLVLRTQGLHPFNPQDLSSPTWDVSFNTAASFVSNTNWQFYAGETTLSYFSQMFGLAVQNFASAAVGIAVLAAFIRGLASRSTQELGNFYVDLTRVLLYILLPLSVIAGLFLISQGVLQNLGDYTTRAHRSPGSSRRSPRGRSPRRRRSSCSAPTAAASSTSTRRCRSRTRRGSRTSSRC